MEKVGEVSTLKPQYSIPGLYEHVLQNVFSPTFKVTTVYQPQHLFKTQKPKDSFEIQGSPLTVDPCNIKV